MVGTQHSHLQPGKPVGKTGLSYKTITLVLHLRQRACNCDELVFKMEIPVSELLRTENCENPKRGWWLKHSVSLRCHANESHSKHSFLTLVSSSGLKHSHKRLDSKIYNG